MDYLKLLEHSYETANHYNPQTRLMYLSESIFGFLTYDGDMDLFLARKAIDVCAVISNGETFEYIKNPWNHTWYIVMCNMPFFADKIEWGTSIRGAWWGVQLGHIIEFSSDGLWSEDGEQITEPLMFNIDGWKLFIAAVIEFANVEVNQA